MYRNVGDCVRTCSICSKEIVQNDWMLDLFRAEPSQVVEWVHDVCARRMLEIFLVKKRMRESAASEPKS